MNSILAGLQIFSIYDPDFNTCAEHDIFYVYSNKIDKRFIASEIVEKLQELGWRYSNNGGWEIFT
jgi:hypothetical protein